MSIGPVFSCPPPSLSELYAAAPDPTLAPMPTGGVGGSADSDDVEVEEAEEDEEALPWAAAAAGVGSGSSVYRSQKSECGVI